ncbi:MAG TPA: DUF2142 domain-containing protein [Caldilineaceae bacterium]|nr:DUF2142 domain-containing protein [Caldilineaceae bacterium]
MAAWLEYTSLRNLLLLGFLLLGFWYSLATPPFETPDELYHYGFVRHIAQGNWLPVQQANVESPWEQEGSQAPLYYLLVGWLTRGIDQSDFAAINVRNPRANIGDPLFPGNKNFMLYSAASHPLRGANLALHVGRWLSLLLGLVTLWCTYATVQLAFADSLQRGDSATTRFPNTALPFIVSLWVATIPQFAFISASCSNDSLIIAVAAATVYWLARLMTKPNSAQITLGEWLVLGILLGIAALSKLQGLGLMGLAGLIVLWLAWRRREWQLVLHAVLPVALPVLLIAGWWYWRNMTLYGDLLGTGHLLANNGLRTDELTWGGIGGELRGLRYSFWGLFGWFNLLLPGWIYVVLDSITLVAFAGLFVRPWLGPPNDRRESTLRLLALLWTVLSLLLLAYWISQATGSQGRLLFPAIGVIIYLVVDGLRTWLWRLPVWVQSLVWLAVPLLLLTASFYTLLVLYPRAYGAPQPVATVPADIALIDMHYRGIDQPTDEMRVLGLQLPAERYQPGERVPVTLYLQADQPVLEDYQLFIQLLNEEGVEIGNLTSHPGWGRHPTSLWQPGAIYADTYPVLIDRAIDNRSPLLAKVYVGFVNPATEKSGRFPIGAYDRDGNEVPEPFLGTVAVSPTTPPDAADLVTPATETIAVGTQFGTVIQLSTVLLPNRAAFADAVQAGEPLTATMIWDAIGQPATDYTAFLHFVDADGAQATGFDQAPSPRFPTSYWRAGDRIVTTFAVPAPTSAELEDYAVWVGLYEAESGGALRLPVTDAAGQVAGDGQVLVRDRIQE